MAFVRLVATVFFAGAFLAVVAEVNRPVVAFVARPLLLVVFVVDVFVVVCMVAACFVAVLVTYGTFREDTRRDR